MELINLGRKKSSFEVLAGTRSAQAALMVLPPGRSTGKPQNEHPQSEQWLFVVSGRGQALVSRHRLKLRARSLLLIEKRERHQITNTGRRPLVTLNFYSPPGYTKSGAPKSPP